MEQRHASGESIVAGATALRIPSDVAVQIIFSGETDIEGHQLYATVSTPFALGIPSANVQMYCAQRFRELSRDAWQAREQIANEIAGQRAVVLPNYLH
jgi:hypothetical protein